ncbi:class D beta-lactamase [Maribacter sp. MAR_2009_72]|uniref:class D beta-lactamase n=1 Tax=Maribacter sp. MAR_2009_72 TaxID=1250050 RepID=UPI00119A96B9|nr:class D beta-lactamase [Maribacter sp. MAR_2009_72]TVZ15502.1 beta-lactamase class D [Maribacter sp. MAR_2009_72]
MRTTTIAVFLILFISCKENKGTNTLNKEQAVNKNILKQEFQSIIDSSDVKGSILIYDLNKDIYYSNDFEWANNGNLPASTFKIANSIIGLETGVIENDSVIFKWDGKKKWLKNWEQDLILRDAFQFSCVHCYQEVARKIGSQRMNDYASKLNYGNLEIDSTNIDKFWLEGESRISQMQQIDFLKRFYNFELPISKRTERIMRNIMLIEETDQYKLSGKSGLSNNNGEYNGWFVGFVEFKNNTYLFATNLEPKKEFDFDTFIKKRLDLTLLGLRKLNVL